MSNKKARPAHFSCTALWVGPRDQMGRPVEIAQREFAEYGYWSFILPPRGTDLSSVGDGNAAWIARARMVDGAVALPSFNDRQDDARGKGRPSLGEAKPLATRYAAWLTDINGASSRVVADALLLPREHVQERAFYARVERYIRRGQAQLHSEGVLPWAAWPDGELPQDWDLDHKSLDALNRWFAMARAVAQPMKDRIETAAEFADLVGRNPWLMSKTKPR